MKKISHFTFHISNNQPGFTVIELLLVITVSSILLGFVGLNLTNIYQRSSITTTTATLIADLRQQQIKAMVGDTEGRVAPDVYGIHFGTTSYTLFHGNSYNAGDPANFTTNLGDNVQVKTILFSNNNVIFSRGTGGVMNFVSGSNTITLQNITNNEQKTITINQYGVVTQVN